LFRFPIYFLDMTYRLSLSFLLEVDWLRRNVTVPQEKSYVAPSPIQSSLKHNSHLFWYSTLGPPHPPHSPVFSREGAPLCLLRTNFFTSLTRIFSRLKIHAPSVPFQFFLFRRSNPRNMHQNSTRWQNHVWIIIFFEEFASSRFIPVRKDCDAIVLF